MVITDIPRIQGVNRKKNLDINPGLDFVTQQPIPLYATSLHQIENNFTFQPPFSGDKSNQKKKKHFTEGRACTFVTETTWSVIYAAWNMPIQGQALHSKAPLTSPIKLHNCKALTLVQLPPSLLSLEPGWQIRESHHVRGISACELVMCNTIFLTIKLIPLWISFASSEV